MHGLGNRKNDLLLEKIRTDGVEAYHGIAALCRSGPRPGVCGPPSSPPAPTAGTSCASVGAESLFDVRIDGVVAAERKLPGKPHPDTFLAAARDLGVEPSAAAVFEDALAGMDAGRAGHFGYVVGVDRVGQADALRAHGADIVVRDLAELEESA